LLGALAVGGLLALLIGYVVLILGTGKADHYGLPVMAVLVCLGLVLGVGLVSAGHHNRVDKD
jgi:hypothetical protein